MRSLAAIWMVFMLAACADRSTEVELKGRDERSPILGITLPSSFEYERNEGVDFLVHYLNSETNEGTIGIYIGNHPSTSLNDSAGRQKGTLQNREVEWMVEMKDGTYFAETLVDWFLVPMRGYEGEIEIDSSQLHIFISANTEQEFRELRGLCESIRLIRPGIPSKIEKD